MTGGIDKRGNEEEKKGKGREGEREREGGGRDSQELEEEEGQCAWRDVWLISKYNHTCSPIINSTLYQALLLSSSLPPPPHPPHLTVAGLKVNESATLGTKRNHIHNSAVHHGGQMLCWDS